MKFQIRKPHLLCRAGSPEMGVVRRPLIDYGKPATTVLRPKSVMTRKAGLGDRYSPEEICKPTDRPVRYMRITDLFLESRADQMVI